MPELVSGESEHNSTRGHQPSTYGLLTEQRFSMYRRAGRWSRAACTHRVRDTVGPSR